MESRKRTRVEDADEEIPKTSKIRACSECKKHKIKCERTPGESDCVRCTRLGFKCVVISQLQNIIDNDTEWKKDTAAQVTQLQAAIGDLLRNNNLPQLSQYGDQSLSHISPPNSGSQALSHISPPNSGLQAMSHISPPNSTPHGPTPTEKPTAMTRANSQELDIESELVSAPMGSLFEVTKLRNLRSNLKSHHDSRTNMLEEDFISRGALSLDEAEMLFNLFYKTMNQFLWGGIALVHGDLTSVRRSSSILSAAILCVAALHVPRNIDLFNTCYMEFIALVSSSTLNRYHTMDEIRGLTIGAFWLSDLSWKLSGHAVRIATEMNLHQSLQKMLRGQPNYFEGAQLWYLLYVCDHHFSIAYGRPPVIHDSPSITNYDAFLSSPLAGPGDTRLCIQVALFIILTRFYHTFGSDVQQPLAEKDFALLRAYNIDVESWRLNSQPLSADSSYIGSYPSKGVVLYYHFAKFQINSLSLRALGANPHISLDRREAANVAISSAMAILNTILHEPDIRNAIVGIPLFTHTMVAFSSVFLIKVAWKLKSASLCIDQHQIQNLVQKVVDLLSAVEASEKHLTYHIASGLSKMLEKLKQSDMEYDSLEWNEQQNQFQEQTSGFLSHNTVFDTFNIPVFDFNTLWGGESSNWAEYESNM